MFGSGGSVVREHALRLRLRSDELTLLSRDEEIRALKSELCGLRTSLSLARRSASVWERLYRVDHELLVRLEGRSCRGSLPGDVVEVVGSSSESVVLGDIPFVSFGSGECLPDDLKLLLGDSVGASVVSGSGVVPKRRGRPAKVASSVVVSDDEG